MSDFKQSKTQVEFLEDLQEKLSHIKITDIKVDQHGADNPDKTYIVVYGDNLNKPQIQKAEVDCIQRNYDNKKRLMQVLSTGEEKKHTCIHGIETMESCDECMEIFK